jgi:hypothetical protein
MELDTSTFVSALYGISGTGPIGKQHPRHPFTRRHLIKNTKFFRESAFQTRFQSFAIVGFKHLHTDLLFLPKQ